MSLAYSLENSQEDRGKRFLYVAPDFVPLATHLKASGALNALKFKLTTTWDMIQAHDPECTVLYIPGSQPAPALSFESIIVLEELLNANIQMLDDLALLDDPIFCKHAPPRTAYLWCDKQSMPSKPNKPGKSPIPSILPNTKEWVCYNDIAECEEKIQMGLLQMEDYMTGLLIMSKKLEQTMQSITQLSGGAPLSDSLHRRLTPPVPEVVLIVGKLPANSIPLIKAMDTLFEADKVASIITCDASVDVMENMAPSLLTFINIADELDKFSIDVMFREIKRRKPQSHTYVFIGEWSFQKQKLKSYFSKLEQEHPSSSFVYDLASWWSLHESAPDPVRVRFMLDPATVIRHFLSKQADELQITLGRADSKEPDEPDAPEEPDTPTPTHSQCSCDC